MSSDKSEAMRWFEAIRKQGEEMREMPRGRAMRDVLVAAYEAGQRSVYRNRDGCLPFVTAGEWLARDAEGTCVGCGDVFVQEAGGECEDCRTETDRHD